MQFTQPWFLLLLLPCALLLWRSWAVVHGMARFRKKLAFAIRSTLLASLVFALAGPVIVARNRGLCTIYLVDRSMSIRDRDRSEQVRFITGSVAKMGEDDLAGVVVFGKDPLIEAAPGGKRVIGQIQSKIDDTDTDIASAIRLASAMFPEGKNRRIVLLSDGNETLGNAREAGLVAESQGVQIDTVPLGAHATDPEASVTGMESPNVAAQNEPFRGRVEVDSNIDQGATIQLERDGFALKAIGVHLGKGANSVVFEDKIAGPGFHKYRAMLLPEKDTDPRNNVGESFVSVRSRPKVLLLQENPNDITLSTALTKSGLDNEIKGPANIPVTEDQVADYDAVILNDINAAHFQPVQMKFLEAAVRDSGIGLAMIGGDNSFLPGGYFGTPISDALAVDLNIKQRKEFPNASILIVVDASGSMGMLESGIEKIRLAANAAEQTIRLIPQTDRIGVAGSSDQVEFIAPMQTAVDKDAMISQLRKLRTEAGGIYCDMSVKFAKSVMEKETNPVRHFIMLADGDDSENQEGCDAIVAQMKLEHITTSTVAIGRGKDLNFLKNLAAIGGGRYYLADTASKLPAILTQDTSVMSRSAIEEGAFFPKIVGDDQVLNGIESTPPLLAYCISSARPLANTSMITKKDDPLLARWQYGLGSSLAFTSDAKPKWGKKWTPWSGFNAFWSQAIRSIVRQQGLNNYQISIDQSSGKSLAKIVATDDLGNPLTKLTGKVSLIDPTGEGSNVDVSEQAPGVFEGAFDSTHLGTYILSVSESDAKGKIRTSSSGFSVPYPPELRTSKPNEPLLRALAEMTDGRVLANGDAPVTKVRVGFSISEVWSLFVSLALILLPFDIAIRRLALPFNEVWATLRSRLARRAVAVETTTTASRLQQAKMRAQPTEKRIAEANKEIPGSEVTKPTVSAKPGEGTSNLLEAKRKRSRKD